MPLSLPQIPFVGTFTWANRPAVGTVSIGAQAYITDIGPARTLVVNDGTYWRVASPTDIVFETTQSNGTTSGADQVVKSSSSIPAGLLRAGRSMSFKVVFAKSGSTDAFTNARMRLGTAGTTADVTILANTSFGATIRSSGCELLAFLSSATVLRSLGHVGDTTGEWVNNGTTSVSPVDVTISDVDANALIFHADIDLAGTTDTPQVHRLILTLYP